MNLTDLKNFLLFFLTFGCLQVFVDAHSLEYQYTMCTTNYTGFPEFTAVGLLDGKQFMSYSSSNMTLILENWIKNSSSEKYWKNKEQNMEGHHDNFKNIFTKIKSQFNHSRGHTLQRMYGCKSDDGGITRRYDQYGFDGEDFISLDLVNGTWIAVKPQALILKHDWDSNGYTTYWKSFLEHDCIDLLNTFVTVERKDPPEASLFQEEVSSPEVVCHATGFFPRALLMTWQKDGEDVHEDVDIRETLPNQDGSFQKRSILKVSAEELRKHTYTCVIEHSSLEKDLVLPVSEHQIPRVRPETSLFQKEASPEVVCHATGFYPKALNISWQKDGEGVLEYVDLRETLPNQDGSFQKRSILKVSAEELQKHNYTCVIEHSSLEKDLVLPVSERRILRGGGSDEGSDGGLIGIIIGVVVALVLVAVVAGIVIWKKKNSGHNHVPVPSSDSPEGDTSSGRPEESDHAAVGEGEKMEMKELNGHSNQNNINTSEQTALDCRNQTKNGNLKN